MPSVATVKDASYPVARALYLYTNGAPQGTVKEFVDFCLSPAGQKIVAATGYVQVN
jgi:phosphate transport system substrate-binding protein